MSKVNEGKDKTKRSEFIEQFHHKKKLDNVISNNDKKGGRWNMLYNQSKMIKAKEEKYRDEMIKNRNKTEFSECTFAPKKFNNYKMKNMTEDDNGEKEKNKQNNLNKLKKEKLKKEMKEIKSKPTISKYSFNNFYQDEDQKEEIHEKLYKMGDYLRNKKQKIIEEKERKDKEKLEQEFKTYKLNYNSKKNRKRMAKSFDNKEKPKGFDEYIIRNRKEILNKKKLKD